jgi:Fe-S oxidoreductase
LNIELQKLESEIIDGIRQCSHCRMCVSVCPTYEGWFTQTSMGRLAAIYAHLRYELGSEEELSKLLFSCSTCRRCQNLCRALSAGADTTDLIVKTRNYLAKRAKA